MAESRKEQIVDTAIQLFSAQGTRPVTTNHIAEAMGISPGNLYYHFGSKEEIIRAIYERAIAEYDGFWRDAATVTPDPLTMLCVLDGVFAHQWKYRCLQRELPVLVRQDELLAARYREMQERRVGFYRFLCRNWIETGSLRPLPDAELDDLVTATWLVGESWLSYLEATGKGADEVEVRRGARLVYTLLQPYLTESAVASIAASAWAS
jgi:AcrR family transcriptional regulator